MLNMGNKDLSKYLDNLRKYMHFVIKLLKISNKWFILWLFMHLSVPRFKLIPILETEIFSTLNSPKPGVDCTIIIIHY